ncbi:hypothetical protein [Chryseobacterium joostei]|nr:hypothetical protein [Chryseobacterium joostei]
MKGKVVAITGASDGIGWADTLFLAVVSSVLAKKRKESKQSS